VSTRADTIRTVEKPKTFSGRLLDVPITQYDELERLLAVLADAGDGALTKVAAGFVLVETRGERAGC
jgi:hypothetical protein